MKSMSLNRELQTGLTSEESFNPPEEIILEILLRLPVKSILKFRCVSKSWLSLISSQQFIETHNRVSTEDSKLNGHRVIATISYPPSDPIQCSVLSLLCQQPLTNRLNIDYPVKHPPTYVWMVGSCNGLICISMDLKDLFLWNPAIKKSKKVPSMDPELVIGHYVAYGFGFDESSDDYKVVGIFSVLGEGPYKYIMMVYGLRTDSWKRIGDLEGGIPLPNSIKFASGKLHWWATPELGPKLKCDIVCLDLASGVYGTVEQPDYVEDDVGRTLGVLGGCICILRCGLETNVDVWVLKEYGVKGSWSKVFHFSCIDYRPRSMLLKPLCLLSNGEILLVYGSSFIVCNPRCDSFTVLKATNLDRFLDVDMFVESLVSPGGE